GYRVTPNVGVELRYAQANTIAQPGGVTAGDVRYETATLDTYYRFNADSKLQPYVLIGGGLARGTGQGGAGPGYVEHTIANAAVGAFYQVTDNLALRGEVRGIEDMQASDHDGVASVGVLYGFGAKKAAAVAPAVVAPVAPV
ncbi:MAG: outer membrane beta-barrel protein, partial [Perlucidibaca sp.]